MSGPRLKDSARLPHYVYRCFDASGRLIYVGCTVNPVARLRAHRRHAWWGSQIASTRLIVFPNRRYARAMEWTAIVHERPRWNVKSRWPTVADGGSIGELRDYRRAFGECGNHDTNWGRAHLLMVDARIARLEAASS